MVDNLVDIKKNLKTGKLVIGTERTLKSLELGKLSKVFASSKTPKNIIDDFEHYCNLSKTELVMLNVPNDELGIICKKPFSISIMGLLK